jgi:hypothetical protein
LFGIPYLFFFAVEDTENDVAKPYSDKAETHEHFIHGKLLSGAQFQCSGKDDLL